MFSSLSYFRFIPSSVDYLTKGSQKSRDQLALPSQRSDVSNESKESSSGKLATSSETNEISDRSQEPRFGFTNVGGTGTVSKFFILKKKTSSVS